MLHQNKINLYKSLSLFNLLILNIGSATQVVLIFSNIINFVIVETLTPFDNWVG